ncbi:MAG TPA: hypothetical protein PKA82_18155 [Pyrinomonadaceae bacterium]|nr:hypothetical protein [Pyrinomonadaceae bacterium]
MLSQDFKDILSAFIDEKVEFMVVGGYAIAFHGYVRGTGDIDLWIRMSDENSSRVWRALKTFGAPLLNLKIEDLLVPTTVFQMGLPPNRIDIITSIKNVEYDEALARHSIIEFSGLTIPIIGLNELLKNKVAMNRPKDQGDIAWLSDKIF